MSLPPGFKRVTPRCPCPVCDKPDWCMVNGQFVYCTRVESDHHLEKMSAWRHPIDAETAGQMVLHERRRRAPINAEALCQRFRSLIDPVALERHAASLGLTASSLRRLGIGWFPEEEAWTFPMSNGKRQAVGIRRRWEDGRKRSIAGGRNGLFVPFGLPARLTTVYMPEGPTNTAALLDLGLPAVGRPDCSSGLDEIVEMFGSHKPLLVLVADRDKPDKLGRLAGEAGAKALAQAFRLRKWPVSIIQPPEGINDPRDWKRAGATREDIEQQAGVLQ